MFSHVVLQLGLDGKYAVSADDAAERAKAEQAKATKAKLEQFQQRENAKILEWNEPNGTITREHVPVDQRVVRICNIDGSDGTIIVSSDLNKLECAVEQTNPLAKSFPDDAENDRPHNKPTKVYGLIKLVVENVKHVQIIVQSKLITGTLELHQCSNVTVRLQHESISTLQVDLCDDCQIQFDHWNPHNRILHAGCRNLTILHDTDSITADYIADGARSVGNADIKEYQFITCKHNSTFLTEPVVTTGTGVPMTQRQVDEAAANRQKVMEKAVSMAEKMVQLTDANGNPLATKSTATTTTTVDAVHTVVEEIEGLKSQGNEAFGMGEYAQAVLQYSLAIDKTAELADGFSALDVLYSNRAAAFLKLGQHEKALADADTALDSNPDNLKAAFRKGLALHASGQYEMAMPILANAHQKEPKNQQIKQALQFCEVRLQQELRKRMQQ